jgi:hypothetical protein
MTITTPASTRRLVHFDAGDTGPWIIERVTCLAGDPLAAAARLAVRAEPAVPAGAAWSLP